MPRRNFSLFSWTNTRLRMVDVCTQGEKGELKSRLWHNGAEHLVVETENNAFPTYNRLMTHVVLGVDNRDVPGRDQVVLRVFSHQNEPSKGDLENDASAGYVPGIYLVTPSGVNVPFEEAMAALDERFPCHEETPATTNDFR